MLVQESVPTVVADTKPGLLYDYYGFELAAYELKYGAPGDAATSEQVVSVLKCGLPTMLHVH